MDLIHHFCHLGMLSSICDYVLIDWLGGPDGKKFAMQTGHSAQSKEMSMWECSYFLFSLTSLSQIKHSIIWTFCFCTNAGISSSVVQYCFWKGYTIFFNPITSVDADGPGTGPFFLFFSKEIPNRSYCSQSYDDWGRGYSIGSSEFYIAGLMDFPIGL